MIKQTNVTKDGDFTTHHYIREDGTTFKVTAKHNPYFDKPLNNNNMDTLKDVTLFHETFGHPVAKTPTLISMKRLQTRIDWIKSELQELEDALAKGDIVECADALADAQYFLSGTIVEFGLVDHFPAIFAEVQRSNMSKSCINMEEVENTISNYQKQGIDTNFKISDNGNYTIYRIKDSKTLKSINWSNPDLSFVKQ